jgi:hypothetical protein
MAGSITLQIASVGKSCTYLNQTIGVAFDNMALLSNITPLLFLGLDITMSIYKEHEVSAYLGISLLSSDCSAVNGPMGTWTVVVATNVYVSRCEQHNSDGQKLDGSLWYCVRGDEFTHQKCGQFSLGCQLASLSWPIVENLYLRVTVLLVAALLVGVVVWDVMLIVV